MLWNGVRANNARGKCITWVLENHESRSFLVMESPVEMYVWTLYIVDSLLADGVCIVRTVEVMPTVGKKIVIMLMWQMCVVAPFTRCYCHCIKHNHMCRVYRWTNYSPQGLFVWPANVPMWLLQFFMCSLGCITLLEMNWNFFILEICKVSWKSSYSVQL